MAETKTQRITAAPAVPITAAFCTTVLDEDLYPEGVTVGYAEDACIDLAVRVASPQKHAHETYQAPLGVRVDVPEGHVGLLLPRSSTAHAGVRVPIVAIDPGYTGEVHAWLTAPEPYRYARGEVLVGLVILPCVPSGAPARKDGPRSAGWLGSSGG